MKGKTRKARAGMREEYDFDYLSTERRSPGVQLALDDLSEARGYSRMTTLVHVNVPLVEGLARRSGSLQCGQQVDEGDPFGGQKVDHGTTGTASIYFSCSPGF